MFQNSFVAIITPFKVCGSIDFSAFQNLLEMQINAGTQGIVVLGTTGESPTISASERRDLAQLTMDVVNKRVPLVLGTGTNSTRTTIELTQQAANWGFDAALVITPYYNKPLQSGLLAHFTEVSKVAIPQILYNVPSRTGCDLLPETVLQLSEQEHIVGLKDASGDLSRIKWLSERSSLQLLTGNDDNVVDFIHAGGHGVVSVAANILPYHIQSICTQARKGYINEARSYFEEIQDIINALFIETNPIPVKYLLAQLGYIQNYLRLPLLPLGDKYTSLLTNIANAINTMEIRA